MANSKDNSTYTSPNAYTNETDNSISKSQEGQSNLNTNNGKNRLIQKYLNDQSNKVQTNNTNNVSNNNISNQNNKSNSSLMSMTSKFLNSSINKNLISNNANYSNSINKNSSTATNNNIGKTTFAPIPPTTYPSTEATQNALEYKNRAKEPLKSPVGQMLSVGISALLYKDNMSKGFSTPSQGDLTNNLYDNGPLQAGQLAAGFTAQSKKGGPFSAGMPAGTGPIDIFATAHWLRNIGTEFGLLTRFNGNTNSAGRSAESITKGITWAASQFLLASLNPTEPELGSFANAIWNPLSLPLSAVPLARSTAIGVSPNAAAAAGLTYKQSVMDAASAGTDRLRLMRSGLYVESPNASMLLTNPRLPGTSMFGDLASSGEAPTLANNKFPYTSIEGQVDQTGKDKYPVLMSSVHKNLYTENRPYKENLMYQIDRSVSDTRELESGWNKFGIKPEQADTDLKVKKVSNLFIRPNDIGELSWVSNVQKLLKSDLIGKIPKDNPDNLSARFQDSKITEINGVVKQLLDDAEVYMPFMFQDLRSPENEFLYFRAFLREGFSETFTPIWNPTSYYGRVDDVPTYQKTGRTISFGFDVVAWSPIDLPIIYKKLNRLESMVYPEFDTDGYLNKGPIIRLRIGDIISSAQRLGIPGYITNMQFSYDGSMWNLEDGMKAPMKIRVDIQFTILHEGNPGIMRGREQIGEGGYGALINGTPNSSSPTWIIDQSKVRGIMEKVAVLYTAIGLDGTKKPKGQTL